MAPRVGCSPEGCQYTTLKASFVACVGALAYKAPHSRARMTLLSWAATVSSRNEHSTEGAGYVARLQANLG